MVFISYIGVILHPYWCYFYVCLYYHACLHYVNKKWSDKDTDCTCSVYSILKWFTSLKSHESQLSVDIWYDQLFVFWVFVSDDFTPSPLGVPAVRWILKGLTPFCGFYYDWIISCFYHLFFLYHTRKHHPCPKWPTFGLRPLIICAVKPL